jgi:ABC-2 type transport system ATP-binding protein
VIRLASLTKQFPGGKGIFDLDIDIERSQVFGYVGPNGAGKTTTLRHLMGFMRPTSGSAKIDGLDCWEQAPRIARLVGYLPGEVSFGDQESATDLLDLLAGMHEIKDRKRERELIDRFELDVRIPIRKMSKGTKQKLAVVAAFMHDPDVYILDEPTDGLDPLMQRTFVELVLEEKARGKTILLSSHQFTEVERTCDRVGIIRAGRLLFNGSMSEIRKMQRRVFEVELSSQEEVERILQSKLSIVNRDGRRIRVEVQGDYNSFLCELCRYQVSNIDTHTLSLEEIFLQYYPAQKEVAA